MLMRPLLSLLQAKVTHLDMRKSDPVAGKDIEQACVSW